MADPGGPSEISGQLSVLLAEAFTGVQFQVSPLVVFDVTTLDVVWTDGPTLHEVDLVALEFVLHQQMECWDGFPDAPARIDRISKRRTMSPATEEMLRKVLVAALGIAEREFGGERMYPLPPALTSLRHRAENGTPTEFMDQLFEATSFSPAEAADKPGAPLCRCELCA